MSRLSIFNRFVCLVLIFIFVLANSFTVYAQSDDGNCGNLTAEDCLSVFGPWQDYVGDGKSNPVSNGVCDISSSNPNAPAGEAGSYPIKVPVIKDPAKLAAAIDQYIKSKSPESPLNGLGKYFVEGGMRAGINPLLAVAQSQKESTFGTKGIATNGSNNAMGRRSSSTQPNVNMWYKYESWAKSLYADSFPASGKVEQPDDWFQYIARVYSANLDSLDSFANKYAPPSQNKTAEYISAIISFTNEMLTIAGDSIDMTQLGTPTGNGGGSSTACAPAKGAPGDTAVAAATSVGYAWPEYHSPPFTEKKPEYSKAIDAAISAGQYVGGGQYPGIDCGGFVTRVMIDSGFEPNYNYGGKGGNVATSQIKWLQANWTMLSISSTSELQPGDVAVNTGRTHTFMFVGSQPGFGSQVASASFSTSGRGWRAPMAGKEQIIASNIEWYRQK